MNLALLDPFRRQIPDRIDSTLYIPPSLLRLPTKKKKNTDDNTNNLTATSENLSNSKRSTGNNDNHKSNSTSSAAACSTSPTNTATTAIKASAFNAQNSERKKEQTQTQTKSQYDHNSFTSAQNAKDEEEEVDDDDDNEKLFSDDDDDEYEKQQKQQQDEYTEKQESSKNADPTSLVEAATEGKDSYLAAAAVAKALSKKWKEVTLVQMLNVVRMYAPQAKFKPCSTNSEYRRMFKNYFPNFFSLFRQEVLEKGGNSDAARWIPKDDIVLQNYLMEKHQIIRMRTKTAAVEEEEKLFSDDEDDLFDKEDIIIKKESRDTAVEPGTMTNKDEAITKMNDKPDKTNSMDMIMKPKISPVEEKTASPILTVPKSNIVSAVPSSSSPSPSTSTTSNIKKDTNENIINYKNDTSNEQQPISLKQTKEKAISAKKDIGLKKGIDSDVDIENGDYGPPCLHVKFNRRGTYVAAAYEDGRAVVYDFMSRTVSALYRNFDDDNNSEGGVTAAAVDDVSMIKRNRSLGGNDAIRSSEHEENQEAISPRSTTSVHWSRRGRVLQCSCRGEDTVRLIDNTHPLPLPLEESDDEVIHFKNSLSDKRMVDSSGQQPQHQEHKSLSSYSSSVHWVITGMEYQESRVVPICIEPHLLRDKTSSSQLSGLKQPSTAHSSSPASEPKKKKKKKKQSNPESASTSSTSSFVPQLPSSPLLSLQKQQLYTSSLPTKLTNLNIIPKNSGSLSSPSSASSLGKSSSSLPVSAIATTSSGKNINVGRNSNKKVKKRKLPVTLDASDGSTTATKSFTNVPLPSTSQIKSTPISKIQTQYCSLLWTRTQILRLPGPISLDTRGSMIHPLNPSVGMACLDDGSLVLFCFPSFGYAKVKQQKVPQSNDCAAQASSAPGFEKNKRKKDKFNCAKLWYIIDNRQKGNISNKSSSNLYHVTNATFERHGKYIYVLAKKKIQSTINKPAPSTRNISSSTFKPEKEVAIPRRFINRGNGNNNSNVHANINNNCNNNNLKMSTKEQKQKQSTTPPSKITYVDGGALFLLVYSLELLPIPQIDDPLLQRAADWEQYHTQKKKPTAAALHNYVYGKKDARKGFKNSKQKNKSNKTNIPGETVDMINPIVNLRLINKLLDGGSGSSSNSTATSSSASKASGSHGGNDAKRSSHGGISNSSKNFHNGTVNINNASGNQGGGIYGCCEIIPSPSNGHVILINSFLDGTLRLYDMRQELIDMEAKVAAGFNLFGGNPISTPSAAAGTPKHKKNKSNKNTGSKDNSSMNNIKSSKQSSTTTSKQLLNSTNKNSRPINSITYLCPRRSFQDLVTKNSTFACCDFSGDGEIIVGVTNSLPQPGDQYELYLWNANTGDLLDRLTGPQSIVYTVSWHPTRSFLAVGTSDGLVDVWGTRMDWTAFAPDFQALPMNVEYIEREDEFDIVVPTDVNINVNNNNDDNENDHGKNNKEDNEEHKIEDEHNACIMAEEKRSNQVEGINKDTQQPPTSVNNNQSIEDMASTNAAAVSPTTNNEQDSTSKARSATINKAATFASIVSDAGLDRNEDENKFVDVMGVDRVPAFDSDSEDEDDIFYFGTKVPKTFLSAPSRTSSIDNDGINLWML